MWAGMPRPQRPRAEVEEALIEASITILGEQGIRAVTSRSIAKAAGVNPGLVHRYFGSMNGLYGRVLDVLVDRIAGGIGNPLDTRPGSPLDLYVEVLVFAMHEGLDPVELQHEHPVVERLLEMGVGDYGVDEPTTRIIAAQLFALFLGWQAFHRFCAHAAGIELPDPEVQIAWLRQTGMDIAAAAAARQAAASGSA
jgi:AcrR family transcriptional regulator